MKRAAPAQAQPSAKAEGEQGPRAGGGGRPPEADTTMRRIMKRLRTHAEAAQSASAQAKQAVDRQPAGPGQDAAEDEDTALRRIVQNLHESSTRTAETRALRMLQQGRGAAPRDAGADPRRRAQDLNEASAKTVEMLAPRPDRGGAPPGADTTLGRMMKKLRAHAASAQARPAAQAPGAAQAAKSAQAHAKAKQTMQAAQAQMQQAMQALQADGGARKGPKGKGLFARAFAALRGAGRKPQAPSGDSQMLRRVNTRELRAQRDAQGGAWDEELDALGGGAILSHLGFDPSSIEYVQTSVGNGVIELNLHSGPDWRIYHFTVGAEPFWLLCPKEPPQESRRGRIPGNDPRAHEIFLIKKLKRTLEAMRGRK
jgi:hypothetical protein